MGVRSGDQIVIPRKSFTGADLNLFLNISQIALTLVLLYTTATK